MHFCHSKLHMPHWSCNLGASAQFILLSVWFSIINGHWPIAWVSSTVWLTSTVYWGFMPNSPIARVVDMTTVAMGACILIAISSQPVIAERMQIVSLPQSSEWACMVALVPYSMAVSAFFYMQGTSTEHTHTGNKWHACIHVFATIVNCVMVISQPFEPRK